MDKSQSYPDIPGAKEYYCEAILPSEMAARALAALESSFYEAYVEQYFAPCAGGRGYSQVIRECKGLTKEEAIEMMRTLEDEFRPKDCERYSFYVSYRKTK